MTRTWRVRGLGSLDLMLRDDGRAEVLELNARLPASASLYAHRQPLRLHWRACMRGELPLPELPLRQDVVRGVRTVFAPRPLRVDARIAAMLAARPNTHDLPRPGAFVPGDGPLCSLSAVGADACAVRAELERSRAQLLGCADIQRQQTLEAMEAIA